GGGIRKPRASRAKPWVARQKRAQPQRGEIPQSQTSRPSNSVSWRISSNRSSSWYVICGGAVPESRPVGAFGLTIPCYPGLTALGYRISPRWGWAVRGPQYNVELVRSDGTGRRQLVKSGSHPSFSPNGKTLVYVRQWEGAIRTVGLDGANDKLLFQASPNR